MESSGKVTEGGISNGVKSKGDLKFHKLEDIKF